MLSNVTCLWCIFTVIRAKQVSVMENVTLVFPAAGDLVNYTVQDSQMPPAQIRIPGEVLEERSGGDEGIALA